MERQLHPGMSTEQNALRLATTTSASTVSITSIVSVPSPIHY
jgi:hypothetical protein